MSNPRVQCSGSSFELRVVMMSESDFVQHKMETERPDLLDVVGSSNVDVWMEFCKAARDEFHRFKQIAALPGGRWDNSGYMGELRIAIQVGIETRHRQSSANSTASVAENTHRGVNEDDIGLEIDETVDEVDADIDDWGGRACWGGRAPTEARFKCGRRMDQKHN